MAGIFTSYHRQGSQGFAGRLTDDLIDRFGEAQVFRDIRIRPGDDFKRVIQSAIAACNVLLAVIGPHWLAHRTATGKPRIHAPDDWVRLEIEAAFDRGVWVVPVLVGGARVPPASTLPTAHVASLR